jgi:hypothetical protein
MMKTQIRKTLFVFAAASALTVLVSTSLASPASRDFSGYQRVVSNGQEIFCDKEKEGHFLRVVCYTRNQMEERQRAVLGFDSGPALLPQTAQFLAAGRSAS